MGSYNYFQKSKPQPKKTIHPVWYGIGCVMSILTPIISWAAALVFLEYGLKRNWTYLYALNGPVNFPGFIYKIPIINSGANYLSGIPYLEALVMFFVLFVLLFSGLFALLNAILYRKFGPPRFSSIDAPPPARKIKRYTR